MRVLQISNYYYPNIGGIEQVTRDIVNALSDMTNISQKVICFNENSSNENYVCYRRDTLHDRIDGVEIIRCGCITKIASQSISLSFPREIDKIINNFSPNIIIFHYPNPYQATFLMKHLNRDVKFILYWHLDIVKQKLLGALFHKQTIELLKRADIVIATSPLYVEGSSYLKRFKEKCRIIPNSISEKRMQINNHKINMLQPSIFTFNLH